jgi:uncharacterized membrane protein
MPQDNREYLQAENTANENPDTSQKLTRTSVQAFSGPLPPPSVLKGYEEVVRGSAEMILVMAEKQQAHRTEQEKKISDGILEQGTRGQHYALTVVVLFLSASVYLAMNGHETIATIIASLNIVGLVSAFIAGKVFAPKVDHPKADS